jgi:rieske iron-sulfur protein
VSDIVEPPTTTATDETASQHLAARRRFLKSAIALSAGAFALAFALPAFAIKTLSLDRKSASSGDKLVFAMGSQAGQPVNANQMTAGEGVQVYPSGKTDPNNLVELVKLDVSDATNVVAFSAICTHLGCTIYAQLTEQGMMHCPCHGSQFNPTEEGKVVQGPASRPLPSLPIKVGDDGTITVEGDFSGPIGVA